MDYTIGEVAKKMNLTTSTLRYYEKEGLLPHVQRSQNGIRGFQESDLQSLKIIGCLKASGLSIKDIKKYIDLCGDGDNSLQERYELFLNRKKVILEQIEELNNVLEVINYKCWYYEIAIEAGTEQIHKTESQKVLAN